MSIPLHSSSLFSSYTEPTVKHALRNYLEGDPPTKEQIEVLLAAAKPSMSTIPLYRLVGMRRQIEELDTLQLKPKTFMSFSDRRENALYAGSSYAHDWGKTFPRYALLSVTEPVKILFTFPQLVRLCTKNDLDTFAIKRLKNEREFIATATKPQAVETLPKTA
jgi:hypothetical protein